MLRFKSQAVKRKCSYCNKVFYNTPYAMEMGHLEFCQRTCWEEWRRLNPSRFTQLMTLAKLARTVH